MKRIKMHSQRDYRSPTPANQPAGVVGFCKGENSEVLDPLAKADSIAKADF